ncbi:bifunctional UDP-sugar hydrolase/5'-nucleotidase [Kurthia sp. Dielmo]|uniref:bifunctional metallophosphatase/5'-nucleotidase n=1 Tax=Kurthia sp. Dielmo TaxID=1033738 RepID=UPI001121B001|nr:5'-nucleotidase C-terminal domain-containing protein [Kurthia sp. Dielmo]
MKKKRLTAIVLSTAMFTSAIAMAPGVTNAKTTYKIVNGKLVDVKTKKVVKGYKTYNGKLYKDGKLFKGIYKNTYYNKGKKASYWYNDVYYHQGKPYTGYSGQQKLRFKDGLPLTGEYNKILFEDGKRFNGWKDSKYYLKGHLANGNVTINGKTYKFKDGVKQDFSLTIMHTNDTHAHLDSVAKRVTAINEIRKDNPSNVLLDAGDVFSGTLYFNEFKGQADLEFMNMMGYDAATFGNHEFDLGSSAEGHQALVDFIKDANFPFVSANVDFSKDDKFKGLFSDLVSSNPEKGQIYTGIIKEVDGQKVGIFGLTTAETKDISSPGSIEFNNYIAEAQKAVKAFKGQNVDKIIALTHIGYDDSPVYDNDQILAKTVKGIDVIVGGHTHTKLDQVVTVDTDNDNNEKAPTVIVQTGQYGENLGNLSVTFDKKGEVTASEQHLVNVAEKAENPAAAEKLKQYKDRIAEISNEETGVVAEEELTNPRASATSTESVRANETALGDYITDGMLAKAKTLNNKVVLALQNGGGIRSSINAGPITVGEVIAVLPFGNTLATVDISGADLRAALEHGVKDSPKESGGFLHIAGGKYTFDSSKPAGSRIVSFQIKQGDDYVDVKDDQTYTIATNAFTAKGGDGFATFEKAYADGRVQDLGLSDWENFEEQLKSLKTVNNKTEGRIIDVAK